MKTTFAATLICLASAVVASPVPEQETFPNIFGGVNPQQTDGQKGITGKGGNLVSNIFDAGTCLISGFLGGGNPNCQGKGSAVAAGNTKPSGTAGGAPGGAAGGAAGASASGTPGAAASGGPGGAAGGAPGASAGGAPGGAAGGAPGATASGAPSGAAGGAAGASASASGAPGASASAAPGGSNSNSSSQSTRYTYNYSTNSEGKLEVDVKLVDSGRMCHYTIDAQGKDVKSEIAAQAQKCIAQNK